MSEFELPLLDSPTETSLQEQLRTLRAELKSFERTFEDEHGRKPKRSEIKTDASIAAKYKQYQRVQDVLRGKLSFEKLQESQPGRRWRSSIQSQTEQGPASSPRREQPSSETTPKKIERPYQLDPYDVPPSATPNGLLRDAIGPTPHRDGQVLGLFDLLQRSGSARTPSSSARKRKLDELYQDTPAQRTPLKVIQSPSRMTGKNGETLEFWQGTPQKRSAGTQGKLSRTPQSEGKKFQLSYFFATPSASRHLFSGSTSLDAKRTPLRDSVFALTPQRQPDPSCLDATPAYLKRTTSFKDRLLSASQQGESSNTLSRGVNRAGPPTLHHFRSSTHNVFTLKVRDHQPLPQYERAQDRDSTYDDDLEALRQLEGPVESHVLVEDSQLSADRPFSPPPPNETLAKPHKKKGQKRTTRRSNIRPVAQINTTAEPKYVAADDSEDDDDDELVKVVKDSMLPHHHHTDAVEPTAGFSAEHTEGESKPMKRQILTGKESSPKSKSAVKAKTQRPVGMINPNAQSHMNFRSLKIKNKNSRARGAGSGRGRFGRRR